MNFQRRREITLAGIFGRPRIKTTVDGIIDCTKGPFAKLGLILNQYADHLIYVLRTKTRFEQKELLRELNNYFPSLDV